MTTPTTLWDALRLDEATPPVVALVGGGGKTTALFRLGREARARGLAAVLTGTTRFTTPPALLGEVELAAIASADQAAGLAESIAADTTLIVHGGDEPKARRAPVDASTVDALASLPGLGLLVLEADGSKMLPFKAPAEHEPIIPPSATHVVALVGLRALDAPLDDEHVHRPERVRAIVGDEDTASIEVIARVLTDLRGGRKAVEDRDFTVVLNQADLDPERALALAEAIRAAGAPRVVVAALRDDEAPIRAVLD